MPHDPKPMRAYVALALSLVAAPTHADTLVKAGEWRTVVTGATPQPTTIDRCMAETTMERAAASMATAPGCTKRDIKLNGNVATLDIVCTAMSMQGTATFDGDSTYRSDMTVRMAANPHVMHVQTTARWIGACHPGETPSNPADRPSRR